MRTGTSRALEVVVTILLAAAAITGPIGIYESSKPHHSAAVWWAICGGAFMLAVLVALFALVVHPLFVHRRQQAAAVPAPAVQPAAPGQAWMTREDLANYLDEINRTMEEHGFGRNPNLPESKNGNDEAAADQNPRETYRAALIGKGMDVRRGLFPGAGVTNVVAALIPFDSRPVTNWLSEAQTYLYVEGSAMADAKLVRGYFDAASAVKAVDDTLEALRQLGVEPIPF